MIPHTSFEWCSVRDNRAAMQAQFRAPPQHRSETEANVELVAQYHRSSTTIFYSDPSPLQDVKDVLLEEDPTGRPNGSSASPSETAERGLPDVS
jgi:hypothetical protein